MHLKIVSHTIDTTYAVTNLDQLTFPRIRKKKLKIKSSKLISFAAIDDNKMIGLVLLEPTAKSNFKIISFYVRPEARNSGVGKELFGRVDRWLQDNVKKASIIYQSNFTSKNYLHKILNYYKWDAPELKMVLVRLKVADIRKANYFRLRELPKDYQALPWHKLNEAHIRKLEQESQLTLTHYDPFQEPLVRHDSLSYVLLYKDDPVGWLISHKVAENLLQRTCFYLKKEHRLPFLAQAFSVIVIEEQYKSTFSDLILQFAYDNEHMKLYYEKSIRPFITEETNVYKSSKKYL